MDIPIPRYVNANNQDTQPEFESTPPPTNGFPIVQGWTTDNIFNNLDKIMAAHWSAIKTPKLFIYVWNASYLPDAGRTVQTLASTIARLTKGPEPIVSPPAAANHTNKKFAMPWCYLVTGLPQDSVDRILKQRCWSTRDITFFALPQTPIIEKFLCGIENLTFPISRADDVVNTIRSTLQSTPNVASFILANHDGIPDDDDPVSTILNSITVQSLEALQSGGIPKLIWNVYATPPTQIPTLHAQWRELIQPLTFQTTLFGKGVVRKQHFNCYACKSIDHPAGLCPFPKIPGWLAPPLIDSKYVPSSLDQNEPSHRGRGRGYRSRGNPRGRGTPNNRRGQNRPYTRDY
jgi:hypothetical protein